MELIAAIISIWVGCWVLSCLWRPYGRCPNPWCSTRKPKDADSSGNYRLRRSCRVCGSSGHWRRLGARFLGRGRLG